MNPVAFLNIVQRGLAMTGIIVLLFLALMALGEASNQLPDVGTSFPQIFTAIWLAVAAILLVGPAIARVLRKLFGSR